MDVCAKSWAALGLSVALVCGGEARGDAFLSLANQRNTLPGGRGALMGGAFVALSDDTSASYYNPAGLAFIKENSIDFSASAYQVADIEYENTVKDEPFREHSELIFPNFIGATTRFSRLTMAYSYMTLDARNIYQQNRFADISTSPGGPNSYSRTYQEASTYYWVGGSAALKLGDRLSLGSSLFYYQRNIEFSTNELLQLNGGGIISINDTLKTLNTGLAGVQGLMWRDTDYSLGASVKTAMALSNRSTLLIDEVQYDPTSTQKDANGNVIPTVTNTRIKHKALNELNPTTYSFGAAWHPGNVFTLSGEVLVHEGVKSQYKDRGGFDLHTTPNYSAGMDFSAGYVDLMVGYFTNNSMYRAPDPAYSGQPVHLDFVGESGGLGWNIGSLHGQAGFVRQRGTGEAQIRNGDTSIQKVRAESDTYIMSGKLVL